jgi:hypothetical protein
MGTPPGLLVNPSRMTLCLRLSSTIPRRLLGADGLAMGSPPVPFLGCTIRLLSFFQMVRSFPLPLPIILLTYSILRICHGFWIESQRRFYHWSQVLH